MDKTRNAIEHYEWDTTEKEAKLIVGNALSFALSFANEHLKVDLAREFKKDDTFLELLSELWEFALAHGQRMEVKLTAQGVFAFCCNQCGWSTVTSSGCCEVCGHWQDVNDDGSG